MLNCRQAAKVSSGIGGGATVFRAKRKTVFLLFISVLILSLASASLGNLVGYWPLDGDGTDESDHGNDGSVTGSVTATTDRFSTSSGAMNFGGGSGDYIDVGDPSEYDIRGEITLMGWCWFDSSSSNSGRVISKQGGYGDRGWVLTTESTWQSITKPPVMWIASSATSHTEVYDGSTMPLNQWFHFAGVYTPGASMKLYINGDLVETRTSGVPTSQFSDNDLSVRIGNRHDASTCGWKGKLDDVCIFDVALTEDEIEDAMDDPLSVLRIANSSFEFPNISGYSYNPSSTLCSWVRAGGGSLVLADSGSVWGATAYSGGQYGVLQGTVSISQDVSTFTIGNSYKIHWVEADRPGSYGGNNFRVLVDTTVVGANHTVTNDNWVAKSSDTFVATDTTHTIKFDALNTAGGDRSVYLDYIYIENVTPEEPAPVAHWKFDESSGSSASDSEGSNTGTLINMSDADWVSGYASGNALDFDGTNDYVNVPDSDSVSVGNGDFTISFWVYPHTVSITHVPISKIHDTSEKEYMIAIESQKIGVDIERSGNNGVARTYDIMTANEWQHIRVTYDVSAEDVDIYLDGVNQSLSVDTIGGASNTQTDALNIGRRGGSYQNAYFNGLIDDVKIYDMLIPLATSPTPAVGATGVTATTDLSWTAGSGATSHDVYFGVDSTPDSTEFKGNQGGTTYDTGTMDGSTTYYWRIDEVNAQGTHTGVVWSFTTEAGSPPGAATNPTPANSAANVAITTDLSWSAGSGATSHDVYFGTSSPGSYQGNQGGTTYDTGTMTNDTTYYWRIDEVNANGTTTGTVWSFTTIVAAPGQASGPSPINTANGVGITTDISWMAGARAASHDVYFGVDSTPDSSEFKGNQGGTTYDTGTMSNDTTYYWRIDEVNAGGTTTGVVWSFTTIVAVPGQATSPTPANSATDVGITTDLSWTAGARATSHDVYFGDTSPGSYQGNQPGTTYDTGIMSNSTTYYWRIDEVNAGGTTTGTAWSFTTAAASGNPPAAATNPTPSNSATSVAITTDLSWTAGSGATSHNVYFGQTSPGTFQGNQAGTTFDTGTMSNSTVYYWRIDEVNTYGTTTGTAWSFTTIVTVPSQATSPTPANSATGVAINTDLSWTAGAGTSTHDVYFGQDSTPDSGEFQGNQAGTTFDTGTMSEGTTYYWRIDEVNAAGTTTGTVWSFTTVSTTADIKKGPYLIYEGTNTEMTVLWQLDDTSSCTLEWGLDTSYTIGSTVTTEYGSDHQHKYTITGLPTGTKYYYRITIGANQYTGSFRTAPSSSATSVKFLAYGDTRTYPDDHDSVCEEMVDAFTADPAYQTFTLHVGDFTSDCSAESYWTNEFFNRSYSNTLEMQANLPINGCVGNHEWCSTQATYYNKYYPYTYVDGMYWSFDYGPAHIAVIDQYDESYGSGSDQLAWLESDLANTTKEWVFILLHEPGYSAGGGHSNNTTVQTYIQPLCETYGVDIVFAGHNHYYSRHDKNGVKHITTGGGGAPLYTPNTGSDYHEVSSENYHFCKIDIDGTQLDFQAVKYDGTVLDSFTLEHGALPLVISNLSPSSYEISYDDLDEGELMFADRTHTFTDVPAEYEQETYIKTENDDKESTGTSFVTFNVNQDCTVYVAHDDRITTKPAWMTGWTDTGDNLTSSDASNTFSLYSKDFDGGQVTLGGNYGTSSYSMYSIVVVGKGTGFTTEPELLNGSFEYPDVSGFEQNPSGTDWTKTGVGYMNIADDGSAFGNTVYEGSQIMVMQRESSVYQNVSGFVPGKTYTVSWAEADRDYGYGGNDIRVWIDSALVADLHTAASTNWSYQTSAEFQATSTVHTLEFEAVNTGGGDKSIFIDAVSFDEVIVDARDMYSDTWVAVDDLDRELPGYAECGAPRSGVTVAIFYFLWLGEHGTGGPYDVTDLLAANPTNPSWGPEGAYHHWGEPELGYYLSDDEYVMRKHAHMLADAGIDVIVFDVTNGWTYESNYEALCRVFTDIRAEGGKTPQIAFLANAYADNVVEDIYDNLYSQNLYPELWFYWKGKPLMLAPLNGMEILGRTITYSQEIQNFFNFRYSWANNAGEDNWAWIDLYPQQYGWHESSSIPEQISVSMGHWPHSNIGRSFSNGSQPSHNQYGLTGTEDEGINFAEQWSRLNTIDPEFLFITGWNEWVAQRKVITGSGDPITHFIGDPVQTGDTWFIDAYNQEYSRDGEPMKDGHTDNYYYQMIDGIRRYKGVRQLPVPSAATTISIDGSFSDWDSVTPEYRDWKSDTTHRNAAGWGSAGIYTNTTGRNDFVTTKVARDSTYIYFYMETKENITSYTDNNWMMLFINADQDYDDGWQGYDYVVNMAVNSTTSTTLKGTSSGWNWSNVDTNVSYQVSGNKMEIRVERSDIGQGSGSDPIAFDFHWADNIQNDNDIIEFAISGDSAPGRRFNYRYEATGIGPGQATNPSPANAATSVNVDADLSWTAGAGATSHDVYFGTDSTPDAGEFKGNESGTSYDPGTMAASTVYYWRIDEISATGTTIGTVWNFTTAGGSAPPLVISNLDPSNYTIVYDALDVGQLLYIDRTYKYDSVPSAYQGETFIRTGNNDKDSTGTSFMSFYINQDCDVYVAHDDRITTKPSWLSTWTDTGDNLSDDTLDNVTLSLYEKNFSTGTVTLGGNMGTGTPHSMYTVVVIPEYTAPVPPGPASNPSPANGAGGVLVSTDLSWSAGSGTDSHDVYFGVDSTPDAGEFKGNQGSLSYDPGTLSGSTTYYWRIDEVNTYGTTTGTVWSFTTSDPSALPRVIVSTDIGGQDPDDYQSMVHYLVYADKFDTEGLIASPPYAGRKINILQTIDAYETDYSNLNSHADFPTPQSLRDVTKQGAIYAAPSVGYSSPTEGSNWIISRANVTDSRPLWILVWGSITDVAQAVHDDPGIKSKIRVYSIGSWNTDQCPYSRDYLYNNHSDMWWIENDSTMRGMYLGGYQSGDYGNVTFVATHVRYHGALGDFYYSKKVDLKMGDTPSVLYLLNGDPDSPTTSSWGGMFRLESVHNPPIWTDRLEPEYAEGDYDGAKTVNIHRVDYLDDWETRMDWADAPAP